MKIETRFTHDKVRFDQENDVHLVVSFKAPKLAQESKRAPVALIPIIDVSGSMKGEKLDYAKKTLLRLVDHLQPGDYCGLGAFSTEIYQIQKPIEMTQAAKDALKTKIGELVDQSSTNFSGGVELGINWSKNADLREDMLVRVIVLTDGNANHGITKREDLLQLVRTRGRATVSFFGYGTDADQELLADLAKAGDGNYAFIRNPDGALTAFGKELGGLLSTYAQNIVVDCAPHNGHKISEVVSDVDVDEKDQKVIIKLGDILAEEERHVVFAMKLSAQTQALPRDMNVLDIRVSYDVLDGAKRDHRQEEMKARLRFVKSGEEQVTPTFEVDKIVGLAQLVKAQIAAEERAKRGDFTGARQLLGDVGAAFKGRKLDALEGLSRGVQARVSSRSEYLAGAGYLRSSKGYANRAFAMSEYDHELSREVKTSGLAMDFAMENSMQSSTSESFAAGGGGGCAVVTSTPPVPPVKEPSKEGLSKSKSARW